MTVSNDVAALKERHHATWAAGDYAEVARLIEEEARVCVERAGVQRSMTVLDVATGTGNAAILAAERGAQVTGLDLTPELFEAARARAREAGVQVEWVAGDAEDLPFADASFDRVTSTFGVQFAPRHRVVAQELVRVCTPGGLIVLVNWTADGAIGELFKIMSRYLPPPPEFASPPPLWGNKDHVNGLFKGMPARLAFERRTAKLPFDSGEDWVRFFESYYGPTIKARDALEPSGRWAELRAEMVALGDRFLREEDGRSHVAQDYFVICAWRGE